ncbi:MAG: SPOR domain-containing protein [Terriglobia bacterium]
MSSVDPQTRGLSLRQLTFIFFAAVGLCAIFFALGFLIGANRRNSVASPVVEQVPPPSDVPAPVDTPLQDSQAGGALPASKSKQSPTVIEQNLPSSRTGAEPTSRAGTGQPAKVSAPQAARHAGQPGVMVQVAALRTERDAQSLLRVLKSHGYRAILLTPGNAHARDNLYRVQVGPFPARAQAVRALHKLSSQGFRPFIKE